MELILSACVSMDSERDTFRYPPSKHYNCSLHVICCQVAKHAWPWKLLKRNEGLPRVQILNGF